MKIKRLDTAEADFDARVGELFATVEEDQAEVTATASRIVRDVRRRGDEALIEYTRLYDHRAVERVQELSMATDRLRHALEGLDDTQRSALQTAADRLRRYAERQRLESWSYEDEFGNRLGQKVEPLDRVGIYVPGGKAAYPSSVLMNTIPARVAGVGEVVMCVPAPGGLVSETVLGAAALAGVDRVFTLGGAQAVAALAYGTETVPAVDKIVGPGNAYVAAAKRLVFGQVGIDMIAGPSEVLIIADATANPQWVAMDLFSQAEHDERAQAVLVSPDTALLDAVQAAAQRMLGQMPRADIIRVALDARGALIKVRDLNEAAEVANRFAPEHLELAVAAPDGLVGRIRHAGAIFVGRHTAEVMGDYCAGPNHVLPTGRSSRFSSPLGVYDFQKRSSVIRCTPEGAAELARTAALLARAEGLEAHARSADMRRDGENG